MTLRPTRPRVHVSSRTEVAQRREQSLRHDQSQQNASEALQIADKSLRVSEKSLAWTKLSAAVAVIGLAYPLAIGTDRPDQSFASVDPARTLTENDGGHQLDRTGKTNFDNIVANMEGSISNLPGAVSGVSYAFGIMLSAAGILTIKDHVENPGNARLQDGAIRLAAGGGLFPLNIPYERMEPALLDQVLPGVVEL